MRIECCFPTWRLWEDVWTKCTQFLSWMIIYHRTKKHLNIDIPLAGYGDYRRDNEHEEQDATNAESASLRKPVVQRRRRLQEDRPGTKRTKNVFMNLASEQCSILVRTMLTAVKPTIDRSAKTFLENSRCSYETNSQLPSALLV